MNQFLTFVSSTVPYIAFVVVLSIAILILRDSLRK